MLSLRVPMRARVVVGLLAAYAAACSSNDPRDPDAAAPSGGPIFGADRGPVFGADGGVGTGNSFDPDQACAGQTAGAESKPAVLELVVDTSGSMDQVAPGSNGSKWTVTRQALLDAIAVMPPETSVGLAFYPDLPIEQLPRCFDEQADVGIARLGTNGSAHRRQIQKAFQNQSPDGGTRPQANPGTPQAVPALPLHSDKPGADFGFLLQVGRINRWAPRTCVPDRSGWVEL